MTLDRSGRAGGWAPCGQGQGRGCVCRTLSRMCGRPMSTGVLTFTRNEDAMLGGAISQTGSGAGHREDGHRACAARVRLPSRPDTSSPGCTPLPPSPPRPPLTLGLSLSRPPSLHASESLCLHLFPPAPLPCPRNHRRISGFGAWRPGTCGGFIGRAGARPAAGPGGGALRAAGGPSAAAARPCSGRPACRPRSGRPPRSPRPS